MIFDYPSATIHRFVTWLVAQLILMDWALQCCDPFKSGDRANAVRLKRPLTLALSRDRERGQHVGEGLVPSHHPPGGDKPRHYTTGED